MLSLAASLPCSAWAFQSAPSRRRVAPSSSQLSALPKEKLIALAKDFLENPSPDALADDYVFRGPVIGPLCKEDISATLKSVGGDIQASFPDLEPNAFGFTADDPIEPNRVWYFVRPRGTFSGKPFKHPVVGDIEATGAKVVAPPEARSMVFDDEGKIKHVTVGYVVDRFTGDTTGGKGAVFGLYHVMGQEIDATIGSPVTSFLQRLPDFLPEGMLPRSYSKEEDIPAWWTDKRRGADA